MADPQRVNAFHRWPRRPVPRALAPLRATLASVSANDLPRPFRWGTHRHEQHELVLPFAGTYRCRINGGAVALDPGGALLVLPGDDHEDPLATPVRYGAVWFSLPGAGGRAVPLLAPASPVAHRVVRSGAEPLVALWERLRAEVESGDAWSGALQDVLAAELVWRLARLLPAAALAPAVRAMARSEEPEDGELRRLFADHLDGGLSAPGMAQELGISESALASRCRRAFGLSPAKAYARARIERAAELIAGEGLTVQAVAERLGFASPFHFSRLFKRHYGVPPSQLRRPG